MNRRVTPRPAVQSCWRARSRASVVRISTMKNGHVPRAPSGSPITVMPAIDCSSCLRISACVATASRNAGRRATARAVTLRDRHHTIEVTNASAEVRGDDGEDLTIAYAFQRFAAKIESAGSEIAQNRRQSAMEHGQRDERTGVRRNDHGTPAAALLERRKRNDQRRRSGTFELHGSDIEKFSQ